MRTAAICPTCATYLNALCILYNGEYLSNLDINPLDDLQTILEKINDAVGALTTTTSTTVEPTTTSTTTEEPTTSTTTTELFT